MKRLSPRGPITRAASAALALVLTLPACAPDTESRDSSKYEAKIRRTTHGIPHIEAADLASLGFGEGYAQAEDHLCTVADQVIRARAERAKYFGRGEDDRHLNSDIALEALRVHERAADDLASQPEDIRDWYQGYVDGYNQVLAETGVENVPGWCQGAEWVFPITTNDLAAYHRLITIISSNFVDMIATATPPTATSGGEATGGAPFVEDLGASNGWAIGRDLAASGHGMLIANPHYPWVGSNRFWEKHLTIPGELDVYGVGLIGVPGVAIGFNDAVAWTHTVSAGERFTLYALQLVPGEPTKYLFDGEQRDMTVRTVNVEIKDEETLEHDVYFSHHGPILNFPQIGWNPQTVIALRDVNEDNDEGRAQWMAMNRASSMAELQQAHADHQGMPWVNTIATSAEGIAWYTDSASTPNLSKDAIAQWRQRREKDPLTKTLWDQGMVLLDGSDSTFDWVDDPDARDPGVVAFDDMPQIERTDYVFNANDTFWLANSSALIEGDYSPMHGEQRTQRSMRTRNNDLTLANQLAEKPAGEDGKFTLDEMADALLANRSLAAALLKPELVERCQSSPTTTLDGETVDLTEACAVLAAWDGRYDLDSVGAVLFREFMGQYDDVDLYGKGALFAVDYDPSDPVNTPRGLAEGSLALENLARAVQVLERAGHSVDVALGELQFHDKAGRRIPIHGGQGSYEGLLNMQHDSRNTTTLEPRDYPETVEGSRFLTTEGYPVIHGSSFILALEYTDEGPHAKAFLTYSQSGDPESPLFSDQTELFSKKQWRPVLFSEEEIAPAVVEEKVIRGG